MPQERAQPKPDAWMPVHIGDYLADTMHLSVAEHGGYLLLLMHSWRTGPLPDSDRALAAIARMDAKAWRESGAVLRAFFTTTPGGLVQGRLERERAVAGQNQERRTAKARDAAEKRWGKQDASNPPCNAASTARSTPTGNAPSMPGALPGGCPLPSPEEEPPSPPSGGRSPRPAASVGSRLPDDWGPSPEDAAFARSVGVDPAAVAASFRDHWRGQSGAAGRKADWSAVWRNWCRREPGFARGRGRGTGGTDGGAVTAMDLLGMEAGR